MANVQISQSSIVEAFLLEFKEGQEFMVKDLCALDPRLRPGPVSAYLDVQRKKGRLEITGKRGIEYVWSLPREFFEIPHRTRKYASPGGNGSHPGKKMFKASQFGSKKPRLITPTEAFELLNLTPPEPIKLVGMAEKLLVLALRAERGEAILEDLLLLALDELRGPR